MWETDTVIRTPESVFYDEKRQVLYASLIDGQPWEADGKGGVAKISLDGITIDQDWVKGLNCPKGIGVNGSKLYVADLNEVVVVSIKKGSVESRIKPPGAVNLNDIIVTPEGVVFVSDSKTGKIFKIENEKPEIYLDSIAGINGLHYANGMLILGAGKNLVRVNGKKELATLATVKENIDGIEPLGNGDYIVSSWVGYVYYVYADGTVITLIDTHEQKKNAADIGYNRNKLRIYVPSFFGKTVAAYDLKFKELKKDKLE
jgi:hypothetical protein